MPTFKNWPFRIKTKLSSEKEKTNPVKLLFSKKGILCLTRKKKRGPSSEKEQTLQKKPLSSLPRMLSC